MHFFFSPGLPHTRTDANANETAKTNTDTSSDDNNGTIRDSIDINDINAIRYKYAHTQNLMHAHTHVEIKANRDTSANMNTYANDHLL